ncbi:MAG: hypothetical protein ACYCOO_06570 [Chitinophagaceae bacterium]
MPSDFSSPVSVLSPALQEEFEQFLEVSNPKRLNLYLRRILLDYLRLQWDSLPLGFEECLGDWYALFELLDRAEQETHLQEHG